MTLFDLSELPEQRDRLLAPPAVAPAALVARIPRCAGLRRGTGCDCAVENNHLGPETLRQQHPAAAGGDHRVNNGHNGFDLPDRPAGEPHRVPR